MSEVSRKIPKACHYIYFHIDDDKEINAVWNYLTKDFEKDTDGAACALEPTKDSTISISLATEDMSGVYLSCFQDVATIGILFYSEETTLQDIDAKRNQLEDFLSSQIGEATVLIVDKEEQLEIAKETFSDFKFVKSGLSFGKLYHFLNEDRGFYFCLPFEKDPVFDFLVEELPFFDVSFQSLDKKVKYFQDQVQLMEQERVAADKFVSKLLYSGIGKKQTDVERIEGLEKEIDDLSQLYEKTANYTYMIKNAVLTVRNELLILDDCLSSFCIERRLESEYIQMNKRFQDRLETEGSLLSNTLTGIKTAIDIVDTKVGLQRGKESLTLQQQTQHLQEEGTSMQMATSMIEFVLVFFYSLESWEILSSHAIFELIPVVIKIGLIGSWAFMAVIATHFLALSWRENWKLNKGVIISFAILIAILISIILITQYYAGVAAHAANSANGH
ncbi:MAG: light-harvesting protein [Candidatus Sifarchaeia archaeon]